MNRDTLLTAAALVFLLLGSTGLLIGGIFEYVDYANPYSYVPTSQVELIDTDISPKANYSVIFVLDGVRADFFYETRKSNIEAYGDWANFTDVECSTLLSVSRAGYGVISSGVNTSESQVIGNDHSGSFTADSLWNATLRNGGTTAFVGSDTWFELFGDWMNYSISIASTHLGEATVAVNVTSGQSPIEDEIPLYSDAIVSDYAVRIVNRFTPTFMVVHFSETDDIGHSLGPLSDENREALERQDSHISQILAAYDALGILNSTMVVVTSDHGQVSYPDRGGQHGGIEREALHIPLLFRGPGVLPGAYNDSHHQNSIAPTISAAMGWAIPSDVSGNLLFECLDLSTREEAVYRYNQASLRLAHARSRAQNMGYASFFEAQLESANDSLFAANISYAYGAFESSITSARLAESESVALLRLLWDTRVREDMTFRYIGLFLGLGIISAAVVIASGGRRRIRSLADELAAHTLTVVSSLLYLGLLPLVTSFTDWQFSASYIAAYLSEFIYLVLGVTLFSFILSFLFLHISLKLTSEQSTLSPLKSQKGFLVTTVILYFIAIIIFVGFNSLGLPWYATDVALSLMYFFLLLTGIFFIPLSGVALLLLWKLEKD